MFVYFVIQLGSSAGTFPIETAPYIYRIINKLSIMTYSVDGLRMTISGITPSRLIYDFIILMLFMFGSIILSCIVNLFKKKSNIKNNNLLLGEGLMKL